VRGAESESETSCGGVQGCLIRGVLLDRRGARTSWTAELSRVAAWAAGTAVYGAGGICAPAQAAEHRLPLNIETTLRESYHRVVDNPK